MEADYILSVPTTEPERVFAGPDVEKSIVALIKRWHPDLNPTEPRANEVTAHLNALAAEARGRLKRGEWSDFGQKSWSCVDGRVRRLRFKRRAEFELGEAFYGAGIAGYSVREEHEKLFTRGVSTMSTLHYADDKMKAEIGRYMPDPKTVFRTSSERVVLINKPPGTYTLRDVLGAMGGRMPPEHVAWITSSLLNVCCYLQWARMSHGDISMDTVYVQPSTHSIYLLGGWWYTVPFGDPLTHVTARTHALAPRDVLGDRRADERTDLILAKALARELLGDPSGMGLRQVVPDAMREFLTHPSSGSALEDYQRWKTNFLPASFERRFVPMNVTDEDVFR